MLKSAECIAFANQKGGTGKTTSCLSIAGFLAKNGGKVLVVDFDPQASATSGLGIDKMTLRYSMHTAYHQREGAGTGKCLCARDRSLPKGEITLCIGISKTE